MRISSRLQKEIRVCMTCSTNIDVDTAVCRLYSGTFNDKQ